MSTITLTRTRPAAWAGYAAAAWAIAYAVGVRGYHAAGGTLGMAGTFEDPDAMRRASLLAGIGLFLVGVGALAFVRPWGSGCRAGSSSSRPWPARRTPRHTR